MDNIITLYKECKSEKERQEFVIKQHSTLSTLIEKNKQLEEQVAHLKEMLTEAMPLISTEKIIVTPEEALIDQQIKILNDRSLGRELTLEDIKKLDLLIKNKNILKEETKTIEAASYSIKKNNTNFSKAELIQIAQKNKDGL